MLSEKEIELIKHTLGLDNSKESYRNYFSADKDSEDYSILDNLCEKEIMIKRINPLDEINNSYLFHVTDKGIKILEENK